MPPPKQLPRPRYVAYGGSPPRRGFQSAMQFATRRRRKKKDEDVADSEQEYFRNPAMERAEHIAWAWENGLASVLAEYGIYVDLEM